MHFHSHLTRSLALQGILSFCKEQKIYFVVWDSNPGLSGEYSNQLDYNRVVIDGTIFFDKLFLYIVLDL
jgi:hypothetical protein